MIDSTEQNDDGIFPFYQEVDDIYRNRKLFTKNKRMG